MLSAIAVRNFARAALGRARSSARLIAAALCTPAGRCTDGFTGNGHSGMEKPAAAMPGGLSCHTLQA